MVLNKNFLTPSQYNSIRHFDEQIHFIPPELLQGIGKILVKHVMHFDFCASLLHRHASLDGDCVMVHSAIDSNTDICKMEAVGERSFHKGLSPCSFYLTTAQRFQAFEYKQGCDETMPELGFLEKLRTFL